MCKIRMAMIYKDMACMRLNERLNCIHETGLILNDLYLNEEDRNFFESLMKSLLEAMKQGYDKESYQQDFTNGRV